MPSNRAVIASAGAGKTTEIVNMALLGRPKRSAIVTFTNNNVEEIRNKCIEINGCIPPEVTIYPWYTFVLHEMARPYQGSVHSTRIASVQLVNGTSDRFAKRSDVSRYYFNKNHDVYSDKLSDFALLCEKSSNGAMMRRLEVMFDQIFIDEVQDLAGFDIEIIEALLASKIQITLVGDVRQSTFRTNYARKNKKFVGRGLLTKIECWKKGGLCSVSYLAQSYRCVQAICDLADSIFFDLPKATSMNEMRTGHDGIFIVRTNDLASYVEKYKPQILRLNKKFNCDYPSMNYGASKGLGFGRVLIIPYKGLTKWIATGESSNVKGSADEVYVAITRAQQSVAIVHDGSFMIDNCTVFDPLICLQN
jgi:DNA helicase II / ATP-dependent DNA helicase PcrA